MVPPIPRKFTLNKSSIVAEGQKAYWAGESLNDCPYPNGSEFHVCWCHGWNNEYEEDGGLINCTEYLNDR